MKLWVIGVLVMFTAWGTIAEESDDTIKVGIYESIPFTIKDVASDGTVSWSGVSVDLWERIAADLGYKYEYVDGTLVSNIADIASSGTSMYSNELDVAIGPISITPPREYLIDFSHPYYTSGFGILTKMDSSVNWIDYIMQLSRALVVLAVVVIGSGILMRYIERRRNPEFKEVGSGIWFAITTMTTTGYGDKTPVTGLGRMYAGLMMVTSAIVFPIMIASITTNMVIREHNSVIKSPADLSNHTVGVVKGAAAEEYVILHQIKHVTTDNVGELVEKVSDGTLVGAIHDAPILQYRAKNIDGVGVLPQTFNKQFYGLALPNDSLLREDINRSLLIETASNDWLVTLNTYLGN